MPKSRSLNTRIFIDIFANILRKNISNLWLGSLLASATILITLTYTNLEHNFHWWIDWYNRTLEVATAWENSPAAAWQIIKDSLAGDRNQLYTIPLVPFLLILGKSRVAYQIGLALVYLFPFSLVMGCLIAQIVPRQKRRFFGMAALITLLTPVTWMATFLGIPDTGGAVFIGLATLLYLQEIDRSATINYSGSSINNSSQFSLRNYRQNFFKYLPKLLGCWRIPMIGVSIAMAVILRRHFAYGGVALLGAIGLQQIIDIALVSRKSWQRGLRDLISKGFQLYTIILTCLFTLENTAPVFTNQALATNYSNLYSSWSLPMLTITRHYGELIGIVPWLLVIVGFISIYGNSYLNHQQRKKINIVIFSGVISLGIWLIKLRYGNIFYLLHIIPFIVVGITLLLANIEYQTDRKWRGGLVKIILVFLATNLVIGFTDSRQIEQPWRSGFALGVPPIVRNDYDEIVRLIGYLRSIATKQEPIYVVGYQRLHLSPSLINSGEKFLYGREQQILNILSIPQADSQDYYPLEQLIQAEYIVMPSNLGEYLGDFTNFPANGEWLPPTEYDVVKVVFYMFIQNWLITQDFKELPTTFQLQGDTNVKVYQRVRPTSLTNIIKTLAAMQAEIPELPGSQLSWISISDWLYSTTVFTDSKISYTLAVFPTDTPKSWTRSFLYLSPPESAIKITGNVNFYYPFAKI
ncbi:MAG: hypothetical protein HC916_07735 [Coleofasciculaceae cyanobacterium SM2_1_6]|nr:hypothetical protein [Coleofasciculaceae cyanobacterium SM2_1_6]